MSDEKTAKVKNIFAFLSILFGESKTELLNEIIEIPPDYLIEKFERYVLSAKNESDSGLHPTLRRGLFNRYCKKHNLLITTPVIPHPWYDGEE